MLRSITSSNIVARRVLASTSTRSSNSRIITNNSGSFSTFQFRLSDPTWSSTPCFGVINKRWYTPMTPEEQEKEKARITHLSPEEREKELRELNREIAKLEMLRGINTGELYTWSGRYKVLMRDYALPLFVYYWAVWGTMGAGVYLAIGVGGLDAMEVIGWFDNATGFDLSNRVDPTLGTIGLTLVLNEALEPVRLPFVVATLKPMMDTLNPPKF